MTCSVRPIRDSQPHSQLARRWPLVAWPAGLTVTLCPATCSLMETIMSHLPSVGDGRTYSCGTLVTKLPVPVPACVSWAIALVAAGQAPGPQSLQGLLVGQPQVPCGRLDQALSCLWISSCAARSRRGSDSGVSNWVSIGVPVPSGRGCLRRSGPRPPGTDQPAGSGQADAGSKRSSGLLVGLWSFGDWFPAKFGNVRSRARMVIAAVSAPPFASTAPPVRR
jgi:hypothetical protein